MANHILRRMMSSRKRTPTLPHPREKDKNLMPLSKEEDWVPVKHHATGQIYWWNRSTDQTTALGEPNPARARSSERENGLGREAAPSLLSMVALGGGVGFVFALMSRLF